jgi:hypothetical protein
VDLQLGSLVPSACVCNRLELHDRLSDPCRSRGIPHMVACLENIRNHEPDIGPTGTSPPPTRPEPSDCARSSAHPSGGKCPSCLESLRSLTRISLFSNICNSRLLWPGKSAGLPCLRPTGGRTRLSVLDGAFLRRAHTGSLGSYSRTLALAPMDYYTRQDAIEALLIAERIQQYCEDRIRRTEKKG